MTRRGHQSGFTLLEILVATTLMGIAVVGLMSSLSTSMRNAGRVTDADRSSMLARNKMEELLVDRTLPFEGDVQGTFDSASGWSAHISPFELPQKVTPGSQLLQRIALVVWWRNGDTRREFRLEAYRAIDFPRQTQ